MSDIDPFQSFLVTGERLSREKATKKFLKSWASIWREASERK
jgi:hypothetical protein